MLWNTQVFFFKIHGAHSSEATTRGVSLKVSQRKSAFAKSKQRDYIVLTNILLHVPNHSLRDLCKYI